MTRMLIAVFLLLPNVLFAQSNRISHCIAIAGMNPALEYVQLANYREPLAQYDVRISYVAHSTFLIQSASGPSVATDFTGALGPTEFLPDVVTMNHAHSSHWTPFVHPDIEHVLQGWGPAPGVPAEHRLELGDMLIRNVPTDIRRGFETEKFGNSIFVFEVDGLCIGHLGHLHHEPDDAQYAALGRLDIVMMAVDGGLTLDTASMIRVAKRLKSSVVLPMHWFGRATLEQFLLGMEDEFAVMRTGESSMEISLTTLPDRPTVMVLEPRLLD